MDRWITGITPDLIIDCLVVYEVRTDCIVLQHSLTTVHIRHCDVCFGLGLYAFMCFV